MRIILPGDVFPPTGKGGAAWSSHTLARALIARGHTVTALTPVEGRRGNARGMALGVPLVEVGYRAPRLPFVRNFFRHEALWPRLARAIVAEGRGGSPVTVIHAQHVQTAPAAVLAGRALGAPVVITVRDHWPWHYFATGLHGDRLPYDRPGWPGLLTDLLARLGPLGGLAALPALPYILAHMRRRAAFLARADAVIAVSVYIARRLAPLVPPERIHVLPNMVDLEATRASAAPPPATAWKGALLLFAGKLEPNKGAGLLPEIFRALRARAPFESLPPFTLVVAGAGALRQELEQELRALGVPARFLDWAGHDEVLRLMARCDLLLFPSSWGEPLSRVLLEAACLGAPILAMPTGGTPDIVRDGHTGALAATPETFAARLAALLADPAERQRLGAGARVAAAGQFTVEAVLPRYEALYAAVSGTPPNGRVREGIALPDKLLP
ncbi:MAG: glycosyltransferase family 4 protein [Oscillochloridaceae bacterium]|nr:glycosyltransferase family 4 protein [Chloroflexaceae bacterium]MDW8392403.1 glycosyltransferase family 4 protein [Oscillochloridaceae bacterium]